MENYEYNQQIPAQAMAPEQPAVPIESRSVSSAEPVPYPVPPVAPIFGAAAPMPRPVAQEVSGFDPGGNWNDMHRIPREKKLLRKVSNRVCWTLLAGSFMMSAAMETLVLLVQVFGIYAPLNDSMYYLPGEFFYLAECLAYLAGLVLPPVLLFKLHGLHMRDVVVAEKVPFTTALYCVFFGVFICTLANYPAEWIMSWQQSMGFSGEIPMYDVTPEPMVLILNFISIAVLPPIVEEFFFRGVVLRMFRRWGDGFAVLTSAILFSAFHGNIAQSVFALLCGLVMGHIMVKTNNIWITILIHFINNGVASLWTILYETLGQGAADMFGNISTLVILVFGFLSMLMIIFTKRRFFRLEKRVTTLHGGRKALSFLVNPGSIVFWLYTALSFWAVMVFY